MTFAEQVKAARVHLMISQDELAKQVGVSRITITRWESKGFKPKFLTEQKFKAFCESKGIEYTYNANE